MRTTEEINRRIVVERRNGITNFEDILDILNSLNEQIAAVNLQLAKLERHEGVTVWNCDSPNKP